MGRIPREQAASGSVAIGKKSISFTAYFEGQSYNDGAVVEFRYKKKKRRYAVDTYIAQSRNSLAKKVENIVKWIDENEKEEEK